MVNQLFLSSRFPDKAISNSLYMPLHSCIYTYTYTLYYTYQYISYVKFIYKKKKNIEENNNAIHIHIYVHIYILHTLYLYYIFIYIHTIHVYCIQYTSVLSCTGSLVGVHPTGHPSEKMICRVSGVALTRTLCLLRNVW